MKSIRLVETKIAVAIFIVGFAPAGQQAASAFPAASSSPASNVAREITDPANGDRWLLERDPAAPGGPGRLVLVSVGENGQQRIISGQNRDERTLPPRVIRAGDRLVVEEHTKVMDAELEGVALSGARKGATLRVRLKIGGRVVSAVAEGPGRTVIRPVTGVRP